MLELNRLSARAAFIGVAMAIALFLFFPVLWLITTSFKPDAEIFLKFPSILPAAPTLHHFEKALQASGLLIYLRNSFVTAGSRSSSSTT